MRSRSLVGIVSLMAVFFVLSAVQADTTSWNAVTEYGAGTTNGQTQAGTERWQYLSVAEGTNAGYTLLAWNTEEDAWYTAGEGLVRYVATDGTLLRQEPASITKAAVVGWLSPIAGVIDASVSLKDVKGTGNGMNYALYKSGGSTALASGSIDAGGDTGMLTVEDVSVAIDDMLYFQVGPNGDITADWGRTTFTVTQQIPEPGTIVLLGIGLLGLLAYAWRKRK